MSSWKTGDRVRVVARPVSKEDREKNRYFEHMAGLVGTVTNVYAEDCAVRVEKESVGGVAKSVIETATERVREKFVSNATEEQKKGLTATELAFPMNYVLVVRHQDLEVA
jgi:ribosomal protein L21E